MLAEKGKSTVGGVGGAVGGVGSGAVKALAGNEDLGGWAGRGGRGGMLPEGVLPAVAYCLLRGTACCGVLPAERRCLPAWVAGLLPGWVCGAEAGWSRAALPGAGHAWEVWLLAVARALPPSPASPASPANPVTLPVRLQSRPTWPPPRP